MSSKKPERIVLCKVCNALVPRRKRYHPRICEACQKFFSRTFPRREKLLCSSGALTCIVDASNRRCCSRCRFEKCLAVGMQSKLQEAAKTSISSSKDFECYYADENINMTIDDESPTTSVSSSSSEQTTSLPDNFQQQQWPETEVSKSLALVQDPMLVDASAVEEIIRNCVHGFTILHGLEFLVLKHPKTKPADSEGMNQLSMLQMYHGVATGVSYAQFIADFHQCSNEELNSLVSTFVSPMSAAFGALPGNHSGPFSVREDLIPSVLDVFPEFEMVFDSARELSMEMNSWKPTLVECSLFFSLLLFSGKATKNNEKLQRIRCQLVTAFRMYCSTLTNKASMEDPSSHLATSLALSEAMADRLCKGVEKSAKRCLQTFSAKEAAFIRQIFLTQPTDCNLLVPKSELLF